MKNTKIRDKYFSLKNVKKKNTEQIFVVET